MISQRGAYPHPVLDDSDDVAGTFEVTNVVMTSGVGDIVVDLDVALCEPTLEALLDSGEAETAFTWICSRTFSAERTVPLTRIGVADRWRYSLSIPQEHVDGRVIIDVKIIAARDLPEYRLPSQHVLYGDATFNVRMGDVLADGGRFEIYPEKSFDPMRPPWNSCFVFESVERARGGIDVSISDPDKVVVTFPTQLLNEFKLQGGSPELQVATVVLPALTEVLWRMRENRTDPDVDEDFSEYLWFRAVQSLITKCGVEDKLPLAQAQAILEDPLAKCFAKLAVAGEDD